MLKGTPPGDALPPPPQRATPARKGARCGAGAGSPRPHRPQPGHTGRGTLAARSRGRAVGGGTAPDLRRPSQWWKAAPPGTPSRHPHSKQRWPARAHAVGPVLGPHARTDRTWDKRVAEPWLPAPEDGRPGEGHRLTPDAPHNGGRPPPPWTAPHHPRGTQPPQGMQAKGTVLGPHTHTPAPTARGWRTPTARPVGGQPGEGQRLTSDAPHNGGRHPPPKTPFRHPHSEQRRPARSHALGPVLGPHARTDRTRDTRVAEPWLPAPEDGRPGEGQRLTPDAPHNGGRPTPPGTAPRQPRGTQPPQGTQAKGTVLGPHTHTPAPTARGWRTPTAPPVGGQSREGQRLTPDAPHNGGRYPPLGTPFRHPHRDQCRPARAHGVGLVLGPHARRDRTRDTRVAEPRPPAPEGGRLEEGQRLTPDAPHNGGRPPAPGTAPHHPYGTQPPQGMQAKGTVLGPHHHRLAPTARGWRTPTARPVGGQFGEGERLTTDAPGNDGRRLPGTPFHHPHSEQRRPTRAHAVGPVLGPHARTDRTRDTRVAEPRLPAPEVGRPGEGQRLTPDAPHNGGRPAPPGDGPPPPPRHAAPTGHAGQGDSFGPPHPHTRAHSTWVADPNSPPSGRAVGGGTAPDLRRPSQWWKAPPPGTLFRHPHSEQRRPAKAHAVGRVLGPHARCDGTRDTRVAEPWLPAPEDGRLGEGQRLTPDAPHNSGRPPPPRDGPPPPPRHAAPTGHAGQGDSVGPPHPHTCAHRTWLVDPNSPPSGRAVGGGTAPDLRRPSQRWKAPPPGTPFRHPHSERSRPARLHAVGLVLGPHAHTDRTRNTRVAVPRLPAPEDGRSGERRHLTPDAPHNSGRPPPPRGRPPTTPAARSPHRACRPSQVGGNRDRTAPPQARQTEQGTGAGHAEGHGPRGTALPAPSAGTARGAHATPPREGGERTPRERERTHTQTARGAYQKGKRTGLAERTDRVEWRNSERGYGTPGRDDPPQAARDTRGGKGETGETQHQVPARAPRTGRERRAHTDGALHPPRQ